VYDRKKQSESARKAIRGENLRQIFHGRRGIQIACLESEFALAHDVTMILISELAHTNPSRTKTITEN
jgi:K+-sensing histidine kinase KdpD